MSDQQYWPPPMTPPAQPAIPRRLRATFGTRAVAYLIDSVILLVPMVAIFPVLAITSALGDAGAVLGAILAVVLMLAGFAYFIWNYLYRQGVTGQTIGKQVKAIALVREADMRPVGAGMSFARYLLASAISQVTCGLYGIIDVLWVLFDEDRQRLTDKILKFHVIELDQTMPVDLNTFNPFAPLADETPPAFARR